MDKSVNSKKQQATQLPPETVARGKIPGILNRRKGSTHCTARD